MVEQRSVTFNAMRAAMRVVACLALSPMVATSLAKESSAVTTNVQTASTAETGLCFIYSDWLATVFPVEPRETTTAKPVITRCWECQSHHEGKFYDQCPINGSVDPNRAFLGNCMGACMTHTDDRHPQLVVRGCTASQWGLPSPLPEDGCYPFYAEIWCVCRTDGCNGLKLDFATVKSKQFDYLVDYSRVNANSPSVGHQLSPRPVLGVVLLSTAMAAVVFP